MSWQSSHFGSAETRVIYLAKLAEAVYVLHCFQKKTEQTSEKDIQLAKKPYKDLMK